MLFQGGALFTSLNLEQNIALPLIEHAGLKRAEAEELARMQAALSEQRAENEVVQAELAAIAASASAEIEAAEAPGGGGGDDEMAGGDEGGDEGGGDLFAADYPSNNNRLDGSPVNKSLRDTFLEADEDSLDDDLDEVDLEQIDYSGVRKSNKAKNAFGGDLKANPIRREKTHMPDFAKMTSVGRNARTQDSMNRPYDEDFLLGNPFKEAKLSDYLLPEESEYLSLERPRLDVSMQKSLEAFRSKFGITKMLNEGDVDEEFELEIEENDND